MSTNHGDTLRCFIAIEIPQTRTSTAETRAETPAIRDSQSLMDKIRKLSPHLKVPR